MPIAEIEPLIESLEADLNGARMSRAIFVAGNGSDEEERRSLHKAFADSYAAHAFQHIMNTAIRDTALAIARVTDPIDTNRLSLPKLGKLLDSESAAIIDAAYRWYGEEYANESAGSIGKKSRDMVASRLPVLVLDIKKFLNSPRTKAIRSLRDATLAHTLDIEHLPVTFDDVEGAFHEANRIVSEASVLALGKEWDPTQFDEGPILYANNLWDAVEIGLPKAKKLDKRSTPRVKL